MKEIKDPTEKSRVNEQLRQFRREKNRILRLQAISIK
jgi:hypothetical protein